MDNSRFKFRLWDKELNRFIFTNGWNYVMSFDSDVYMTNYEASNLDIFNISDYVVVTQSTGLYDCEGKEIWEQDIVKYQTYLDEGIALMTWCSNLACYKLAVNKGDGLWHEINYPVPDWRYKVIGNRFENPELLEGK